MVQNVDHRHHVELFGRPFPFYGNVPEIYNRGIFDPVRALARKADGLTARVEPDTSLQRPKAGDEIEEKAVAATDIEHRGLSGYLFGQDMERTNIRATVQKQPIEQRRVAIELPDVGGDVADRKSCFFHTLDL